MALELTRRNVVAGLSVMAAAASTRAFAGAITAHDFAFAGIDGGVVRLADWAGRPVLVVNTASKCGYTYQYDGLQALYDAYRHRGLVVLGVPSDDFGSQELETEAKVKEFCAVNFAIDFPMTAITPVRGQGAHPFYTWAARTDRLAGTPKWNFHKILIAPNGDLIAGFPSQVEPMAKSIRQKIDILLG